MSERRAVLLISAVQLVNILDFMMVTPLGPDLGPALGVPSARLGEIAGSYTAAACVAGFLAATWLDRVDRRPALAVCMGGLFVGTAAGGFATGVTSLLCARLLAGFFGGPATAVALAILADVVPVERRGRAMGVVGGAFSIASVAGVPLALWLATVGGWRLPFWVVGGLGLVVGAVAWAWLPPMRAHLARATGDRPGIRAVLAEPGVGNAALVTVAVASASYSLIPNLPSFLLHNLAYPRESLPSLYLVGGAASFAVMRLGGRAIDRFGSFGVSCVGTGIVALVVVVTFLEATPLLPPMVWFVLFMVGMSTRNVAWSALSSKVPRAAARAGYLSLLSSVQHGSLAFGAAASATSLDSREDGALIGLGRVAVVALLLYAASLPLIRRLEAGVRARGLDLGGAVRGAARDPA